MEATTLRKLKERMRNQQANLTHSTLLGNSELEELLDYVALLEDRNSDLTFQCSLLETERSQWWQGKQEPEVPQERTPEVVGVAKNLLGSKPRAWGEAYLSGTGQAMFVHAAKDCSSRESVDDHCVIHRPMPGPWSGWPTHWRSDRRIMERLCPHGIGHPAPESAGFRGGGDGTHGCDGCCTGNGPAQL